MKKILLFIYVIVQIIIRLKIVKDAPIIILVLYVKKNILLLMEINQYALKRKKLKGNIFLILMIFPIILNALILLIIAIYVIYLNVKNVRMDIYSLMITFWNVYQKNQLI